MNRIFEEHIAVRRPPKNLKKEHESLFEREFSKMIRETHAAELNNPIVLYDTIFKLGGLKLYTNYTHPHSPISIKSMLKRLLLLFTIGKSLNNAVWIIDEWSMGYFHWLTDAMPRLMASKRIQNSYPVLLPDSYRDQVYIQQSLQLVGSAVTYYNPKRKLAVKKLLLPSLTADTGNYNKEIINELRASLLRNFPQTGHRKIFISRKKAAKRKIINEQEVINLLKFFDYEIHCFEDYSFLKQVEIMSQSGSLVGLHGSGLTNMLFMREMGRVLELRLQGDSHNNCFFSLASDLGHDYYYQLSDSDNADTFSANISVDLVELQKNLSLMTQENT